MDPVSAILIAWAITWCVASSAAGAALDQARAEARTAASAIRGDLHGRGDAWAKRMADRLADGRKGGPSTGMWWGWAALRTARTLQKAMRKEPRTTERTRAIRDTSGPFRRIWEAGQRGGRYAANEARRKRDAQEQPTRTPVGVCERCGAVVARTSLVAAPGSTEQLCVMCRTGNTAQPTAEQEPHAEPEPSDPAADRPSIEKPRPEITSPPAAPAPERLAPPAGPVPALPQAGQTPDTPKQIPTPSTDRATVAPAIEGEPMAPRQPGQVVPVRNTPAIRAGGGGGGESYTHGQWNRAVIDIEARLDALPATLEAMLASLTTADAGRGQVRGVMATRTDILAFMGQVRAMLLDVNRRERPVLTAVEAAGGPDEVPGFKYLSEV